MKSNEIRKGILNAKKSSAELLKINSSQRKKVLLKLSALLLSETEKILEANKKDILSAQKSGKKSSFIERLELDKEKIKSMSESVKQIAESPDNLFQMIETRKRPSGIIINKVIFPLGLVAIIYESRPNVTIDAFSLSFKSGNAVILKGGGEIKKTNEILVSLIRKVLKEFKINTAIIQDFSGINKELAINLMTDSAIDCLIPRGGKGLIEFVKNNATVPLIVTGASVVHTYIDSSADLELAKKVIINAKTRRVSICNALDVILIDKKIYKKFLAIIRKDLAAKNVEIRADNLAYSWLKKLNFPRLKKASTNDFDTEFLDYILAIKVVNNFKEAIAHIQKHSLGHSEAIITNSKKQMEEFYRDIDAACLYVNTSTQFGDGGEFGMGGEIGISTQKLHARGPFAYRELTTYKYLVVSKGATRS